jgi:hypothetical protein
MFRLERGFVVQEDTTEKEWPMDEPEHLEVALDRVAKEAESAEGVGEEEYSVDEVGGLLA